MDRRLLAFALAVLVFSQLLAAATVVPVGTGGQTIRKADIRWWDSLPTKNNTNSTRTFEVKVMEYKVNGSNLTLIGTNYTNVTAMYSGKPSASWYNIVLITRPMAGAGTTFGTKTALAPGNSSPIVALPAKNYVFQKWVRLMGSCSIANPNAPVTTITMSSSERSTCVFEAQMGNVKYQQARISPTGDDAPSGATSGTGSGVSGGSGGSGTNCNDVQPICPPGTTLVITTGTDGCRIYTCTNSTNTTALVCPVAEPIYVDCPQMGPIAPNPWRDSRGCLNICKGTVSSCATAAITYVDCSTMPKGWPNEWTNNAGCKFTCKPVCPAKPECPVGSELVELQSATVASICPQYACRKLICPVVSTAASDGGVNIWVDCSMFGGLRPPQWIDENGCVNACLPDKKVCPANVKQPIMEDCSSATTATVAPPTSWVDEKNCKHQCKVAPSCATAYSPTEVDCSALGRKPSSFPWQENGCWFRCKTTETACASALITYVDCSLYGGLRPDKWQENGCWYACKQRANACPNKVDPTYVDCPTSTGAAVTDSYIGADGCTYICNKKPVCPLDLAQPIAVDCKESVPTSVVWTGDNGCLYTCTVLSCPTKSIIDVDCSQLASRPTTATWVDPATGCTYRCKTVPVCATKGPIQLASCAAERIGTTYVDPKDGCTYICPQKADCALFDRVCPAGQALTNDPANSAQCICTATSASTCPPALSVSQISVSTVIVNVRATGSATIVNGQAVTPIGSIVADGTNVASAMVNLPSKPCPQVQKVCPPGQELVAEASATAATPCPNMVCRPKCVGTSQETTASYSIDGQYINSFKVPSLAPGGSYTGQLTFVCLRQGVHTLTVDIQSAGAAASGTTSKSVPINCLFSSKIVQTQSATDTITASMADTTGDMYAKVMGILGVYIESYKE